jgi:N-acetylglucosamine-6-phosphate deacetylase
VTLARTIEGLLVDPVAGTFPGTVTLEGGRIAAVEQTPDADCAELVLPGFIDLHVYEPAGLRAHGVTGYLLTRRDVVDAGDDLCLGLHLEGPFLNADMAGAIPLDEIRPVDLAALAEWLGGGTVRLVTVAPEIPNGLEAIRLIAAAGAVASVGHTKANAATTRAAIDAGARFATHLWNAMGPIRSRTTGPVPELLLDRRVTLGLIGDSRHLHPRIEELTIRTAGADRVALTSDQVRPPAELPNGKLLGGDRCGSRIVSRMARQFGYREAALMSSLVPARVLGLTDRGRLAPGFRADLALLDERFTPLETIVEGTTVWSEEQRPAAKPAPKP